MKYTVNEYLDLIGSGKSRSKKKASRKPKSMQEDHIEAVMELLGMGRRDAKKVCSECEKMQRIHGGSFWKQLKRGFSKVGDSVKRGVNKLGDTVKKGVRDLKNMDTEDLLYELGKVGVSQIPYVGAFGKEGLDALQHHRKYDAKKASKNALIDIGTSFLPPGIRQVSNYGLKKATKGMGKKPKGKRKVSAKMKKRGDMIKQVMKKTGMKLGEASKFLKSQGY